MNAGRLDSMLSCVILIGFIFWTTHFLSVHGTPLNSFRKLEVQTAAGPKFFWYSEVELTWFDAQVSCVNNGTQLLSIKNEVIEEAVRTALSFYQINGTSWISLHRWSRDSPWIWGDATPMTYSNWYISEPVYDAAYVYGVDFPERFGQWYATPLSQLKRFLCE